MRKPLALIFTFALAGIVAAQDSSSLSQETMENADMSDGSTHWHGDCKAAGTDMMTDFTHDNSSAKGISVDLHSTSWTKVTQEIHEYKAHGPMILTIVYQASPDLKFSTRQDDYTNLGPIIDFPGAQVQPQMGQVTALIDMPPPQRATARQDVNSPNTTDYTIYPDLTTVVNFTPKLDPAPQTVTGQMNPPAASHDDNPTFVIAFPPGHGTLTITKISLLPGHIAGAPGGFPGNPFQPRPPLPQH